MFNSEELSNSIQSLSKKAQNIIQKLDRISEDIKSLEGWLQENNICFEVDIQLRGQQVLTQKEKEFVQKKGVYAEVQGEEFIHYKRDQSSGKFRIMYQRILIIESMSGHVPPGFDGIIINKPLIEAPVEVRVLAEKKLPELVRAIEKTIS